MRSAAVVNYSPDKWSVEIREIERPEIGPDDVLLEVANVGVCGSDLHQWTSDHSWVVLGAPLTIDADSFKTAGGDLESSLRLICKKIHDYQS